jgi:hypothetical protein
MYYTTPIVALFSAAGPVPLRPPDREITFLYDQGDCSNQQRAVAIGHIEEGFPIYPGQQVIPLDFHRQVDFLLKIQPRGAHARQVSWPSNTFTSWIWPGDLSSKA